MQKRLTAFTLVELIVVITILAILATIGFVSFSGYLAGTRDTNRIAQLKSMSDALELYRTKKDLPIPDDKVDIKAGTTTIAYQGYIGANVLETIEYTEKGLDPKDKTYFSYYLTKDKKYFQLLSFLEEANTDVVASNIFNNSQAVDYTNRFPKVTGKKLGILTDANNTPIQELITTGELDVTTNTTEYVAQIEDGTTSVGTGAILVSGTISNVVGKNNKSCKEILASANGLLGADGTYWISPTAEASFQVYCDMTTDGGGWTFFGHMDSTTYGTNFFESGTGTYKSNREDDGTKYSLGVDNFSHTEMMATLDNKDPIISDTANKIVFYKYTQGHLGFNTGPAPCTGLLDGFQYKAQIGGSYISGGTANYCDSDYWFARTAGNTAYLVLFTGGSNPAYIGNYWGSGITGNNSRVHDGWWYLR